MVRKFYLDNFPNFSKFKIRQDLPWEKFLKTVKKFYYNSPDNPACASTKRNQKSGIEYCVTLVTVRHDLEEQFFFYYGYHKENFKVLYSIRKLKVPNSFQTTIFGQHRLQYEGGAFDEKKFWKLFFYLPVDTDFN